ncbi:probable pectinesterase/pectinesterase inhibitor 40 [Papaver somniferum]|uniref:probable pectinesterase/pectinesterase inhibitor 40 n=1 Tax=Papaver somniferum TaxID=3469 RepID=UPI000E702BBB|nr:probable pectinesterase/pectinesterase inhibitor 40 [Papaver somniferum]
MYTLSNILKIFLSILLLFSLTATKPIFAKKIHNVVSKSSALSPLQVHDEDLQVAQFNCQGTLHTQLCVSTLNSLFSGNLKRKSTTEIVSGLVSHIVDMVEISSSECRGIKREGGFGRREKMALDQCLELAEDTILDLNHVLVILKSEVMSIERYKHLNTLLSFAMTNQGTCLEEFVLSDGISRRKIEEKLHQISNLVSISLDMLEKIPKEKKKKKKVKDDHRAFQEMGFPSWITNKDKRLVQSSEMVYDLVVAQDGSGNYTTIAQAVEAAPESSNKRFIIYIKEGVYRENVQVARKKTMLMFVGDGIGKTIVISNRSVKDLWTLAGSSTVVSDGCRSVGTGGDDLQALVLLKQQRMQLECGSGKDIAGMESVMVFEVVMILQYKMELMVVQ